ncbi:LPXTG cell wall anchor domain-containing protein [Arenivirga flava]|uniref:Uncharacterized protein n=1 Tax=Arenivirga flava TaxID=1930060 RepID=A0AA37XC36_9MICO|nr:LPXTG cell wall anchor domain-containing protein [Arenivirga flava]GMA29413.1 hypothetical protein GCM10025874_26660 [Arenivirga flava]
MQATRRARTAARRTRRLIAAAVSAALVASVVALGVPAFVQTDGSAPAARAVEQPVAAAPAEPTPVFVEDFERGGGTLPARLTNYVGAGGNAYRATGNWAAIADCNGVILNYATASFTSNGTRYCSTENAVQAQNNARRLADVLGQVAAGTNGSTSATQSNRALVDWTTSSAGSSSDAVLETTANVGGPAATGYYVVSLDVAEASCDYGGGANASKLWVTANAGTTTAQRFNADAIALCATTGAGSYTSPMGSMTRPTGASSVWGGGGASVKAGRVYGDTALLLSAAERRSLKLTVTNATTTGDGNDFAVDNLRIADGTPTLTKAFSSETAFTGARTTLTFTVTNTSERAAKYDWGFTDTLPAGMKPVAGSFGGTCVNSSAGKVAFSRNADAAAGTITIAGGDLPRNASSCTITVDVTAAAAGTYTNGAANIGNSTLRPPQDATLIVQQPASLSVRHVLQRAAAGDQFTSSVYSGTEALATSTTSGSADGLQSAQISALQVRPGAAYTIHTTLAGGGAGLGYTTSYSCERDGVVIASNPAAASGSITVPDEPGAQIVCTFTTAPRTAQFNCDPNHFYSVTENGALVQGDIVTGTASQLRAGADDVSGINALAVAPNGSAVWGLSRTADSTDVAYVARVLPDGSFSVPGGAWTTVDRSGAEVPGGIVAGAIDLESGRYLFGKFNGGSFYLYSFTEATRAYAFVGSFPTGNAAVGNGDMAFDAKGNLSVLGAASNGSSNSATIYTVTKQNLAAPVNGVLTVGASVTANLTGAEAGGFPNVNGLAFSPRGTVYLSNASGTHEFDPTTWKRVEGTRFVGSPSVDLASCSSPSTVTVQKNVIGRSAPADQFTLAVRNGSTTVATATTTGSAAGRQKEQIGPYPAPIGTTLSIAESMAAGSPTALDVYTVRYECWVDGERVADGSTPAADVAMPDRYSAALNCTFFNAPKPATVVTVRKLVQDPATGASTAAAGWRLGMVATATAGVATALPSDTPQQTTGPDGTVSWTVLHSDGGVATVRVSEVQQAGYEVVSLACTVNGGAATYGAVTSLDLTGIAANSSVDCSFTNRPVATLALVVERSSGSKATTTWTASATGSRTALAGPAGAGGAPSKTVSAGVPYRLASTGPADASDAAYVVTSPWSCTDAAGAAVAVSASGDVTATRGSSVTCRIAYGTAQITLLKQVVDPQPGFEARNWTITATPNAFTGLGAQSRIGAEYSAATGGNAASTVEVRPGHGYALTEALTDQGSKVAYQELRLEQLVNGAWVTVSSASITAPAAGQSAVYRFVNAPIPGVVLPLTGGMSTDAFMIAGAIILLLALSGAVVHGSRRRRRSTA